MQAVCQNKYARPYASGMQTPDHSLGERIKIERKKRGWSQDDLAQKVGVRGLAVGKWERAQANPTTDNRIALAEVFGIDVADLGVSPSVTPAGIASAVETLQRLAAAQEALDAASLQQTILAEIRALALDVAEIKAFIVEQQEQPA